MLEAVTSYMRSSILEVLEFNYRAQNGRAIGRPLGSTKHFAVYYMLMFAPKIMTKFSLPENTKIDMQVRKSAQLKVQF